MARSAEVLDIRDQGTPISSVRENIVEGLEDENLNPDELTQLIDALNHLYSEYSTAHLVDPRQIAERDETTEAWNKTFAISQSYYFAENPFDPGKKIERSIPTHGLLGWAAYRLEDPTLTEEQIKDYREHMSVLEKHSKPVIDIDRKRSKTDTESANRRRARIHWELELRKKHGLSTGNEAEDSGKAAEKVEVTASEVVAPREKRGSKANGRTSAILASERELRPAAPATAILPRPTQRPRESGVFTSEAVRSRGGTIMPDRTTTTSGQAQPTPETQTIAPSHPELEYLDDHGNRYIVDFIEVSGGEQSYILRRISGYSPQIKRISKGEFESSYTLFRPNVITQAPVTVQKVSRIRNFFSRIKNFFLRRRS